MDRIWFLHSKGRQEGPLSAEELRARAEKSEVPATDYVWREGMEDWKPIGLTPEFAPVYSPRDAASRVTVSHAPPAAAEELSAIIAIGDEERREHSDVIETRVLQAAKKEAREAHVAEERATDADTPVPVGSRRSGRFRFLSSWAGWVLLTVTVLAVGVGAAMRFGLVQRWTSPVAAFDFLTPEESEELAFAARTNAETDGHRIGFVLSQKDHLSPFIIVAGNFNDGEKFVVRIRGISETLLGTTQMSRVIEGVFERRVGQTGTLGSPDGKRLPSGKFEITVEVPRLNVRAKKTFSLLGGYPQEAYAQQLRDFHAKLRERATKELALMRQGLPAARALRAKIDEVYAKAKGLPKPELKLKRWTREKPPIDAELDRAEKAAQPPSAEPTYYENEWKAIQYLFKQARHLSELVDALLAKGADVATYEKSLAEGVAAFDREAVRLESRLTSLEQHLSQTGFPAKDVPESSK